MLNPRRLAVALLVLTACGNESAIVTNPEVVTTAPEEPSCQAGQVDGDLFAYNWPDYIDPTLIEEFEAEFDVEVIEDVYESDEALFAKLQSGAIYDLVVPSDRIVGHLVDEGFLGPLQTEALPNLSNLRSRFADPPYDPGGAHSVAYLWGTVGLGVNPGDSAADPTWALVFDQDNVAAYDSGISLLDDPRQTIGAALKYLGYSLNSTDAGELQEAADLVDGLDGLAVTFNGETYDQLVESGALAVAHGSSDRLQSETVSFVTPAEGAALWVRAMAVPANAEHPCTAHAFINHILEPANGAALSIYTGQASPNRAALPFVDPEILEDRSIYPAQDVEPRLEFLEDLGGFEEEYAKALAVARS